LSHPTLGGSEIRGFTVRTGHCGPRLLDRRYRRWITGRRALLLWLSHGMGRRGPSPLGKSSVPICGENTCINRRLRTRVASGRRLSISGTQRCLGCGNMASVCKSQEVFKSQEHEFTHFRGAAFSPVSSSSLKSQETSGTLNHSIGPRATIAESGDQRK